MDTGRAGVQYQQTVTVDGEEYKIHLLPPTRGFKLATKLSKLIGEPLGALAASQGDATQTLAAMPKAIKALTSNLADDETFVLIKALVDTASYQNQPINFEAHFQGRLGHMLKLVGKIVEVQFADFLGAIVETMKGMMGKAKE